MNLPSVTMIRAREKVRGMISAHQPSLTCLAALILNLLWTNELHTMIFAKGYYQFANGFFWRNPVTSSLWKSRYLSLEFAQILVFLFSWSNAYFHIRTGGARTRDLQLKRLLLLPTELPSLHGFDYTIKFSRGKSQYVDM